MSTPGSDSVPGPAPAAADDVESQGVGVSGAAPADEDDVEGHSIGMMSPSLARDLANAKERDIARQSSRQSLLNEAKRALKKKS